ncbi:DUF4037 domain-containing protein [Butyrivibrio sp. NC2007]|uniref:DUF4037 domain-containing protein n=1 Tax=Butyrivibrio sp. NC2007 TaxID=1280683 RepID=UPI0003F72348|nr:DUF4037 domain-containing protein [Butyrivibrio sp. NC2007]
MNSEIFDKSRRFYENKVAPMIHEKFAEYESHIAVGLSGEGSDCFGFDDFISRDHDFGTGVCLWLSEEDFHRFGRLLSIAYNELVDATPGADLTDRLRQRRGVMTINGFYSYVLGTEIDAEENLITDDVWRALDHSCLATAVNGDIFRDDLGKFSAFRKTLLDYYPERIWRERIANELHRFASSLQVNYSRCMARKDTVAAEICKATGLQAAMELFFLLKRVYPPYYKWTYRALEELDSGGRFSRLVKELAEANCALSAWEHIKYMPDNLNMSDKVVALSEQIAEMLVKLLLGANLIDALDTYLEVYVDVIL